jgi:hypothetical protein
VRLKGKCLNYQYKLLSCFWVLIKRVLFSHGPNKAFLVPDSCRATERNGNSIRADVTDDANEND